MVQSPSFCSCRIWYNDGLNLQYIFSTFSLKTGQLITPSFTCVHGFPSHQNGCNALVTVIQWCLNENKRNIVYCWFYCFRYRCVQCTDNTRASLLEHYMYINEMSVMDCRNTWRTHHLLFEVSKNTFSS